MLGVFQVKPLGVIWGKYSEFYSKRNTIMFDDIGRNFLMNPQNGLKVSYGETSIDLIDRVIICFNRGCWRRARIGDWHLLPFEVWKVQPTAL